MELCSISGQPYDECDGTHEGECVWQCGDCGGNVYNCICPNSIPEWAIDPRRNGATDYSSQPDIAECTCERPYQNAANVNRLK